MALLDSLKTALGMAVVNADEESLYEIVAREIAANNLRPGLWAMAIAQAGGDDTRARGRYIQLRVAALKKEIEAGLAERAEGARAIAGMLEQAQRALVDDALPAYDRRDYEKARLGFEAAASSGLSWGFAWLGILHQYGLGTKQDIGKAVELFKKGSERNDARAMLHLGLVSMNEFRNYDEAVRWIEAAIDAGQTGAESYLKEAKTFQKLARKAYGR